MPKNIRIEELNLTRDFSTRSGHVYKSAGSLVGWYKFEDEAVIDSGETLVYDYATNNNHGVYHGLVGFIRFPNFRLVGGTISAGGLQANGEGYVELPNIGTYNISSSFSVALWFQGHKIDEKQTIFSIDTDSGLSTRMRFVFDAAAMELYCKIENPLDTTSEIDLFTYIVTTPDPLHIAHTYNAISQEHSFYVNDVKVGSATQEFILDSSDSVSAAIDNELEVYSQCDVGSLAIWSAFLSESEVFAIYNGYLGDKGISGFLNPPVRVTQHENDCAPLSYPAIVRSGPGGISGNEQSVPYDDSKTIVFDSAYANAWVYFHARPKDASTITLFDPAGGIDLLPAVAELNTSLDDMIVESNGELFEEQVYEVEIVQSGAYGDLTEGTGSWPDEDAPTISGQWTGIAEQNHDYNDYDYQLVITAYAGDVTAGSGSPVEEIDSGNVGHFEVQLKVDSGSGFSADPDFTTSIDISMSEFGEEEFLSDHLLVSGTPPSDNQREKLAGIKILWPNPFNADGGTESDTADDVILFDNNITAGTSMEWTIELPKPDKFKWRKANLEDYRYRNNWTDWYAGPDDDGIFIGTGNARRSYTITNTRHSNIESDGYVYSELIDLSQVDTITGELPTGFTVRAYGRGDISHADSNEKYDIEYHFFTSEDEAWPSTPSALGTISELRNAQRGEYGGTDSGSYEYSEFSADGGGAAPVSDDYAGRWNGLMSYAPFADGHKFSEDELDNVPKNADGTPLYEYMPDDPHIALPSDLLTDPTGYTPAVINPTTQKYLQFRVAPGSAVSWGQCQVKLVVHYTGPFLYFDDIDNDDASGNNVKLKWDSFSGHSVGDKWTVNVEDTTSETFEFNRGKIVNPVNTEIRVPRRTRKRKRIQVPWAKNSRSKKLFPHFKRKGRKRRLELKLTDIERDQLNGVFAKAINDSGLQIEAHHDGEKVLLRQTIPGKLGNLEIHADKKAKVYISNSALFTPGGKGEVTGSFTGGDGYLVSYPTTLPAPVQKSIENVLYWANKPSDQSADNDYNIISTANFNLLLDISGKKLYANALNLTEIVTSYNYTSTLTDKWDPPGWEDDGSGGWIRRSYYSDVDSDGNANPAQEEGDYWVDDHHSNDPWFGLNQTQCILKRWDGSSWQTEDDFMGDVSGADWKPLSASLLSWDEGSWREYHGFTYPAYVESPWLNSRIMQPSYHADDYDRGITDCGLVATGSTRRGVADAGLRFTEDQSVFVKGPFVDDQIDIDVDNDFFEEGISPDIYEGFSSPLRSKMQFTIEMPAVEETSFGMTEQYATDVTYHNMVYYNFADRKWDPVGPGLDIRPGDEEEHKKFFEDACIGFSRGVEIIQSGTMTAALPISNFGFPMHPKFEASADNLFHMSNYINKPFILEKFVVEYEAEWTEGTDWKRRSIMYDVGKDGKISRVNDDDKFNNKAAINSFFILNQRDWVGNYEYNTIGEPTKFWYPPKYTRNVTQGDEDNKKNRYMWDGSSYDYDESESLATWFRFTGGSFAPDAWADALSEPDATLITSTIPPAPVTDDSPWKFPPGAPTDGYEQSMEFSASDNTYAYSILQNVVGPQIITAFSPEDSDADGIPDYQDDDAAGSGYVDVDYGTCGIPRGTASTTLTTGKWYYNGLGLATDTDGDGTIDDPSDPELDESGLYTQDNTKTLANLENIVHSVDLSTSGQLFGGVDNRPGSWTYAILISNEPDPYSPSSAKKTKDVRAYYADAICEDGEVTTIKYKYMQGVHPDFTDDMNEPPDSNMEDRDGYFSEALRFQIAVASQSHPEHSSLEWIDINVHEPDYTMQAVWQEVSVTIDPEVYGAESDGYFIRFLQAGTSGWPDAWVITDVEAGSFSSFSASVWFKAATTGSWANILTIAENEGAPNKIWLSLDRNGKFRFLVDSGQNRVYTKAKSSDSVADNQWHHAVFSFSSETYVFKVWLDGEHIGEYEMPQATNDDGELLWRRGSSTDGDTMDDCDISVADVLNAGITSFGIIESYWGAWNSQSMVTPAGSFEWHDGTVDPTGGTSYLSAADLELYAEGLSYNYVGLEKMNIGGIDVTLTDEEFMSVLGFIPARPWYFSANDVIALGADVDQSTDVDAANWSWDNHLTGKISDFALWSKALDGIDAKAIYHLDSGYYKVGKGTDVALYGDNPFVFECPLEKDFEIRDASVLYPSVENYDISSKLLARYLVDPNNFNNLLVSGPVKEPAYIVSSATWCDDGPWKYSDTTTRVPLPLRYGLDFPGAGSNRFYVRLPRANDYFPDTVDDEAYPEFSFFTWIKMSDIDSSDPVIFSINKSGGKNRLIFMVDTADPIYKKNAKPKGLRLALHVAADVRDGYDPMADNYQINGSGTPDLAGTNLGTDNTGTGGNDNTIKTRNWYRVLTNDIREPNGTYDNRINGELNDDEWHLVGFTHTTERKSSGCASDASDPVLSHWKIYFDGEIQDTHVYTYHAVPGAANDIKLITTSTSYNTADLDKIGYDPDIFSESGWQYTATDSSGDSWQRVQHSMHGYMHTNGGHSLMHEPLSFNEKDRVSLGQEYDRKWKRKFKTSRRGVRKYRTFRYRRASQFFEGKMADITLWGEKLDDADVKQIYNARYGTSNSEKWFNDARGTARDLVTYGQWSIYGSVNEAPADINEVLEDGLSRELDTLATYKSEILDSGGIGTGEFEYLEFDGDPNTIVHVTGSYVMEGKIKRPVKHTGGLSYKVGKTGGINGHRSFYRTSHNGTRTGQENDITSARSLFNAVPGSDVIEKYYDFGQERRGFDRSELNLFEVEKQDSPYILLPNDQLIFGWQCSAPYDFKRATNAGSGPNMTLAPGATSDNPARMKITLFGSYIQDGKERQGDLNQNLTSDAIHEALQFETPVHDKFQLEDIGYNAGAYTDDVISGSMFINERYGRRQWTRSGGYGFNVARRKIASVAEHSQGSRGSMLRGVRLVDDRERFFDTIVPSPADYHQLNGNGVLKWSSPLFGGGAEQVSLCFGEPRPSDMKVVLPEKTFVRCQDEGWYEPLPQGVIKLTFSRLWTADDYYGNSSIRSYDHTTDSSSESSEYHNEHSFPWYVSYASRTAFHYTTDFNDDGSDADKGWRLNQPSYNVVSRGTYTDMYPHAAGTNYMFTGREKTLDDSDLETRETYMSIYDANGDHHVVWLNWGGVDAPTASTSIIEVDMTGWDNPSGADADDTWSSATSGYWRGPLTSHDDYDATVPWVVAGDLGLFGPTTETTLSTSTSAIITAIRDNYSNITGFTPESPSPQGTEEGNEVAGVIQADIWPVAGSWMKAVNFANMVASAIDESSMFEVLQTGDATNPYGFLESTDGNLKTYSIYIRTVTGGLVSTDPAGTNNSLEGGGLPGIHYASPTIDSSYLNRNYHKYINLASQAAILDCKYSYSDLRYEGVLIKNNWGIVQPIDSDDVSFSPDTNDADCQVDTTQNSYGYDVDSIAASVGLTADAVGVSDYINNVRPNNPDQFRRQNPVYEDKDGFDRISDYTLDGCYFQIHDAKDNTYNIWYNLDNNDGVTPNPPSTSGILVPITKVPPGAPASTIAYETMLVLTSSYGSKFVTEYEDGTSYFGFENTRDGTTKDADTTIMGLPTTTGFYLTDDAGEEYDNQTYQWSFNSGIGFFSFSLIASSSETLAVGKTGLEEEEVWWHGDPIQEGVDPYHVNTNSTIDSYWLGAYPFEPKYATLRRGRYNTNSRDWNVTLWDDETGEFDETKTIEPRFWSVIITGSNIPNTVQDPTIDDNPEYPVLTVIGDGAPQTLGSNLRLSREANENFFKFYFGCGDTWQKNPEVEIVQMYSDGYDWPSAIPKIRGWKYGLKSALPENSSAVYRHNSYGQFRDMLEQRSDSRFYRTISRRGRFRGRSYPTASPVRCRFVDTDGVLTIPEKTWSQNLSRFCTSSLPYFDDGIARNREHPLEEDALNTSFGIIED